MNAFSPKKILALGTLALSLALTGCLTDDDDSGTPGGQGDSLSTKTVTAGAQSNATYGSSIDVDDFKSYLINDAETRTQEIDLIFAYSTATIGAGTAAIYSPDSAKYGIGGSEGFEFMDDFNNPNSTVIKPVTVDFEDIDTKEKLDSLWEITGAVTNGRHLINEDDVFMVESDENRKVIIRVNTLTLGANGVVNLEGQAKF